MYVNNTTPIRVLPQQVIDLLEGLESEFDRPIMVTTCRPVASAERASAQIDAAWFAIDSRLEEPVPQETKDRALSIVFGATESGGEFRYQETLPTEAFVPGTDFGIVSTWFPGGDYVSVRDGAETMTIGTFRNYAEVLPDLVCFGFRYTPNSWPTATTNAVDWEQLVGEPVRMVLDPEFKAGAEARRLEREENEYVAFMQQQRERALVQARARLQQAELAITSYTEHLAAQMGTARNTALEIAGIEARLEGEGGTDRFKQQWEAIKNHARVRSVRLVNSQLVISTDDMFMTHPKTGETRWLGRFEIMLNPLNGSIRTTNIDNAKGGRDHPHVTQGSPCWGGISSVVSQLSANGDLYGLVDVVIMFLETFNLKDDWGAYASYWFDVPDQTPERLGGDAPDTEPEDLPVPVMAMAAPPITDDIFYGDDEF